MAFFTPDDEITTEPLSKKERAWVKRLERCLLDCPPRLAIFTIGDRDATIFDEAAMTERGIEVGEGNGARAGLDVAHIASGCGIHGVAS
jgi:hypothetical protein